MRAARPARRHRSAALVEPGTRLGRAAADARVRGIGGDACGRDDRRLARHRVAPSSPCPRRSPDFAYISCGTWSLVGVELERPVLSEASRLADFTNEGGVDGRVRYLHNVMGLWLLSESCATWERGGERRPRRAARGGRAVDGRRCRCSTPTTRASSRPATCRERIAAWFTARGLRAPASRPEFVRVDPREPRRGLRACDRSAAHRAGGRHGATVHLVGGGSQNELLCQLTADAHRAAGRRRPGRGDRDRQRARAGARPRPRRRAIWSRCAPSWRGVPGHAVRAVGHRHTYPCRARGPVPYCEPTGLPHPVTQPPTVGCPPHRSTRILPRRPPTADGPFRSP